MRRSKARSTRQRTKPAKRQLEPKAQLDINDRLAACSRGDKQQIVYIGQLVENALLGEFGAVIRALLKGRTAMELNESRALPKVPADRYLGRLDAYERLLTDLEQYVIDKDTVVKETIEKQRTQPEEELHTAPEIGGEFDV